MKLRYYNILLGFFVLGACNKVEVTEPEFEVEAVSTTVKVNEEVDFRFKGDPYQISFYSGEILNDYAHREGRTLNSDGLKASFATNVAYGNHPDLLSVWVSTDFNGNYEIDDVLAATWKDDITKNFTLAPHSQNSTSAGVAVASGIQDLSSYVEEGKPLYIAFRYKKTPDTEGGTQRNWLVRNMSMKSSTILGEQELFEGGMLGFNLVWDHNFGDAPPPGNTLKNSSINAAGTLTIRVPSALGTVTAEVWAISPAINIGAIDMGPDKSVPIKGFADTRSSEYKHTYTEPGVYKATFIASNSSAYGGKTVVREIEITVTE